MILSPEFFYREQLSQLESRLSRLNARKKWLGWLRFFAVVLIITGTLLCRPAGFLYALLVFIFFTGLFLYILARDISNNSAITYCIHLKDINHAELAALEHRFSSFPDGSAFLPADHDYARDLDILGHASLFQYINRGRSEQGQAKLAGWLLAPASPDNIRKRQDAIKELGFKTEWRQRLEACGMNQPVSKTLQSGIEEWLQQPETFIHKPIWAALRFLVPLTSISLLFLHITAILAASVFYPLLFVVAAISFWIAKVVTPARKGLDRITAQSESLQNAITSVEQASFDAPLLQEIRNQLLTGTVTASGSIRQLKKIMDRMDYRLNPLIFIPLTVFLCWDLQQAFQLEQWKQRNKAGISNWFDSLAQAEALSSLATLSFNNPGWCFPVFSDQKGVFTADQMGHPLIAPSKIVLNSFSTEGRGKLNLVTGSNMAGKSTFLRCTGINIILAMAGAPVYASSLRLSPVKLMSSMRVSDNLEENTSTFYAELKKLKDIISGVKKDEPVFLLLDEMLRGTNSADRQAGSRALIRQLLKDGAVGLIATHDIELTEMATIFPDQIMNYHFDVKVDGEELYFDYVLKKGICRSMNASLLMKKIGIEL